MDFEHIHDEEIAERFELDPAPIWEGDDERLEPLFHVLAPWLDPTEPSPLDAPGAFGLDPERGMDEPDAVPPAPRRRGSAIGFAGSLGVHLLVLLALLAGSSTPADVSGAIPVQLVVENAPEAEPAARPEPSAPPTKPPAPSNRAAAAKPPEHAAETTPPAAAVPPPKPRPPPTRETAAAAAAPSAAPAASAMHKPASAPPTPEPAADRAASLPPVPGPEATKGDYLNYLVTLTRRHFDLLPPSFLGGRHGRTILSVFVLDDGTISRIAVKQTSGYPEIDARIEQMVLAVGQFPPVPASFRKPSVELEFNLAFPDALQQ